VSEELNESICGETVDHEQRITYEDSETVSWECTNCGAEWWHDIDEDTP
jgi:hypothetical protein